MRRYKAKHERHQDILVQVTPRSPMMLLALETKSVYVQHKLGGSKLATHLRIMMGVAVKAPLFHKKVLAEGQKCK